MVLYNFKKIQVVPNGEQFVDIVLMRTQRKTPTIIHAGYAISRIRSFYMRKVKFTQTNFHDRLVQILEDFPKIDDIHPFYGTLINVLYDKDHFKMALGQLSMARSLIDNLARDYIRLLKFGQNLFQCKQLKVAAMGRMCTIMRKQNANLEYLETVRQHLSRLPSIDPTDRALIVCGYPNVGKSSFVNKLTRADVEEAPYPFTTRSLFVGHMDYRFLRWQLIDTPGILDHPLEQRNAIEMQAITALAHLQCAVLFFLDLSQAGGYSLDKQLDLFESIRPVFTGKPLIMVANKIDVAPLEKVDASVRKRIDTLVAENKAMLVPMSNYTGDGVVSVRNAACDALLALRVDKRQRGSKVASIANRMTVTMPKPRDSKARPAAVPESVLKRRAAAAAAAAAAQANGAGAGAGAGDVEDTGMELDDDTKRRTLKDVEREQGGPGVFSFDWKNHRMLENDDWKFDEIPEIMNGKNIADYVDPAIMTKLQELERIEDEDMKKLELEAQADAMEASSDEDPDEAELAAAIREKRTIMKKHSRRHKGMNRSIMPRVARAKQATEFADHLESLGIEGDKAVESAKQVRGRSRTRKRTIDDEEKAAAKLEKRRSKSVRRAMSVPRKEDGLANDEQRYKTMKHARKAQYKFQREGRAGESDRFVGTAMPKHLYSGKRGIGKTDWR